MLTIVALLLPFYCAVVRYTGDCMTSTAADESAWRLLFDIALSHGEAVRHQRITYHGFLAFLKSAELLGSKTGVFPVLLEHLWVTHRTLRTAAYDRESATQAAALSPSLQGFSVASEDELPSAHEGRTSTESRRKEVLSHGIVGFEGFTDIMNVISVRCYQTNKCSRLYNEKESLARAIVLSGEDRIHLDVSVQYTASEYLRAFISRNTIQRSSTIALDPMRNDWTQYTNQIITHIIGSLQYSIIIPLFQRYSTDGSMSKLQYSEFVRKVFPHFSSVQAASAQAVFFYDGFFDVTPWINRSRLRYLEQKSGALQTATPTRTLRLDSFVDALLLLSVVAFSDEQRFLRHRSITAKVWSCFEDYYCPAVESAPMAADPLYIEQWSSVTPYASYVYPRRIPVDVISSFLFGGLNLSLAEEFLEEDEYEDEESADDHRSRFQRPGRLVRLVKPSTTAPEVQYRDLENSIGSFPTHSTVRASTEIAERRDFNSVLPPLKPNGQSFANQTEFPRGKDASHVVKSAAKLFPEVFEKETFSAYDCPIYGSRCCRIFVDEEEVFGISRGPNYVEVCLPHNTWNMRRFQLGVFCQRGADRVCRLLFAPVRRLEVSLRDKEGGKIYSSMTVVAQASASTQVLPPHLVEAVESACEERTHESHISVIDFTHICRRLQLVRKATADVMCHTAVRHYKSLLRESGEPVLLRDEHPEDPWMTIPDVLCAIACLCIKSAGSTCTGGAPDIAQFLSLGVLRVSSPQPTEDTVEPITAAQLTKVPMSRPTTSGRLRDGGADAVIPHNGMIDVPYEMALSKVAAASLVGTERRERLISDLRANVADGRISDSAKLIGPPPHSRPCTLLPDFPESLRTVELASQYPVFGPKGGYNGLMQTTVALEEDFLRSEVTIAVEVIQPKF